MKLHFLGHSEFIIEIMNSSGVPVRILSDSWLSEFAFTDFMARNPVIVPDLKALSNIDAVYISHPHCDHLDPYTLYSLYRIKKIPILLPETMSYLKDLLENYLGNPEIILLRDSEKTVFKGISITAFKFKNLYSTNEDDVMPLLVQNENEILFNEVDCAVPQSDEAWSKIAIPFQKTNIKNRVYIATRNELEALFGCYDAKTPSQRKKFLKSYTQRRSEEMEWEYEKFGELIDEELNLWRLPGLTKILCGQGMIYDPGINADFLSISDPLPLSVLADMEANIAKNQAVGALIRAHRPGKTVNVAPNQFQTEGDSHFLSSIKYQNISYAENTNFNKSQDIRPIFNSDRNQKLQKSLILKMLNERFFPYQIAQPEDSLSDEILQNEDRCYIIHVRYGTSMEHHSEYYSLKLNDNQFREIKPPSRKADEIYWANDLDDFFSGRQDVFSTTLHRFEPETKIRFWTSLGFPFLNSDLVRKKIEFHFERASRNLTSADWMKDVRDGL